MNLEFKFSEGRIIAISVIGMILVLVIYKKNL